MTHVFLSYKREDLKAASRLVEALRAQGLEIWWDRDIPAGAPWEATIEKALTQAAVVLVCWSKTAVASDNVRSEARWAREQGRLIQLFVEPCSSPLFFGERQGVDLSDWNGDLRDPRFAQIVSSVRAVVGEGSATAGTTAPSSPPQTRWRARQGRRLAPWLLAAVIATVAVGIVWLARFSHWNRHAAPGPIVGGTQIDRLAAPRFEVLDNADTELRQFAGGLQAEMVDQLNQNQISVVAPEPRSNDSGGTGAAFAFGGTIERDGAQIAVRMQLNDLRQHVTVWSNNYSGQAQSAGVLQDEIAAEAAEVADSAVRIDRFSKGDTEGLSLGIKSDLYTYRDRDEDREAEWENAKLLLAHSPQLSVRHSNFAVVSVFLAAISTPQRAAELRALAAREATAALQLNPRDPFAFFTRELLFPMVGHWGDREAELLAGLKADPDFPLFTTHESNFLREVGRLDDALTWGREAAAPKPATANRDSTLLIALAAAGQDGEASSLADTMGHEWPAHPAVWNTRLQALIYQSRWTDAAALFRPNAYHPIEMLEDERRAWIAALKAMASGDAMAKHQAAALLAAIPAMPSGASMPPHVVYSPGVRIGMLAVLGDTDAAYLRAAEYLKKDSPADSSFLFWPDLASFRRDKRFWPFVARIGLVDYWRATGNWPDFCSKTVAPDDCKTEAAKVAALPATS